MIASTFTTAAVLLAAASQVSALGNAVVHNQCDFDVYLWEVSETSGAMQTIPANGSWVQPYQNNPDGGGISVKMGTDTACQNITQFEYTLAGSALWYDLSNINGYPFAEHGVTVVPTDSTCRGVVCPAGTALCAAAYNIPSDNFATAECGSDADAVVVLCSGDTDTSGSSSVSSIASVAASTATSTAAAPTTPSGQPTTTIVVPTTATTAKPHTWSHPVHHTEVAEVAAPATTEAPAAPAADPYVVVQTTFITHVITVEARSPQPTAEVKRDVHHEHAAVHKEHPVRRHNHARAFGNSA